VRPVLSFAVAVLLLGTACGERASSDAVETKDQLDAANLDEVVLRADEAPEGTDYLPERSGALLLDELWPSDCCPGQQVLFEDDGFTTAYAGVFEKPGHTSDPIDTRSGWEVVSSAAVLFETSTGASEALGDWLAYYDSPVLDRLPTDGLGEEAVAVMGSPNAPAEVFYLYLWRVDRAVLALRASVGTGTVPPDDVRALVDRMDARIS
jgi:hypothetical protein